MDNLALPFLHLTNEFEAQFSLGKLLLIGDPQFLTHEFPCRSPLTGIEGL
jgi:hypothetical protein